MSVIGDFFLGLLLLITILNIKELVRSLRLRFKKMRSLVKMVSLLITQKFYWVRGLRLMRKARLHYRLGSEYIEFWIVANLI